MNKKKIIRSLRNIALSPLSFIWEWVYRLRRSFYEYGIFKKKVFKVPVISVGNLSFGGTGKTPTIIWLTEWLNGKGLTPAVLTRGYRGALEHSSGLLKSGQKFRLNPYDYGDEPLMISNRMSKGAVIVGKKRADNLLKYFSDVKPDVVLLDDGFQHLQIYRSFNLVLFDATMDLEKYHVAPIGYLREGFSALKDADGILVSRSDMVDATHLNKLVSLITSHFHHAPPIALTRYVPAGVFDAHENFSCSVEELKGMRAVAVTAIANPQSFYQYLENFGVEICDRVSFPDHYFFTNSDLNTLLTKATQHASIILCSEKDMVKMKRVSQDPRILYIRVKVDFISGEQALLNSLEKVLKP